MAQITFQQIDNLYRRRLVYFADKILNDTEQSKDIVQEALVKLWQRFDNFENERAIKSFLYLIVKNACMSHLIKISRRHKNEDGYYYVSDKIEQDIMFHFIETEILEELCNGVEKLSKAERKVFRMVYFFDMDAHRVASSLGLSVSTVRNQRAIAVNKMRLRLNLKYK